MHLGNKKDKTHFKTLFFKKENPLQTQGFCIFLLIFYPPTHTHSEVLFVTHVGEKIALTLTLSHLLNRYWLRKTLNVVKPQVN